MRRDEVYLRHILDSIERIESCASVGREEFLKTPHWHDAAIRNFEVIGEASKRLSREFKENNSEIPWRNIAGFRDVLIHDYMGVDLIAVWKVIGNNLPLLKNVVLSGLKSFPK